MKNADVAIVTAAAIFAVLGLFMLSPTTAATLAAVVAIASGTAARRAT